MIHPYADSERTPRVDPTGGEPASICQACGLQAELVGGLYPARICMRCARLAREAFGDCTAETVDGQGPYDRYIAAQKAAL